MTNRERLEVICITAYVEPKTAGQRRLFKDMNWLAKTLKKYMDGIDEIADMHKRPKPIEPMGAFTLCMAIAQKTRLAR